MKALSQSRYNIIVPLRRGRAIAYNSASGATALLEHDELAVIQRATAGEAHDQNEVVKNLVYGGFLVDHALDELEVLETEYKRQRYDPSGMILTIAPTLACNFGCDYCFQGADKPKGNRSQ